MEAKHDQEIDLLILLAKMFKVIRKNSFALLVFTAAGLIAALSFSIFTHEKLKSDMLVATNLLSNQESEFLMSQFQQADTLPGLSRAKIYGIKYSIDSDEQDDIPGPKKNVTPVTYIKITATVGDAKVFPQLEKAILQYLDDSRTVARNRELKNRLCTEMISRINQELKAMEEIKATTVSGTKANNYTFFDPSYLFDKSVNLYNQKLQYEISLEEAKGVHLVKGFGSLTQDARMSKTLVAAIGIVVGLVLFVVFVMITEFLQYYKRVEASL